jgi:hypothetical protein
VIFLSAQVEALQGHKMTLAIRYNIVHNCHREVCTANRGDPENPERSESKRTKGFLQKSVTPAQ